jgi:hypothetical protein
MFERSVIKKSGQSWKLWLFVGLEGISSYLFLTIATTGDRVLVDR